MASCRPSILRAVQAVKEAKALIITAGAGMGVDSGLPDFRGPEGFWKAYPPLRKLGISLAGMSNPQWFDEDPEFAWGFFGHRYNLYAKTEPHHGFKILKKWAESMENGYFVYTSNVDGHFQKAGFDPNRIEECHESLNYLQCVDEGCDQIWPFPEDFSVEVDEETLRCTVKLPMGPPGKETHLARPNVLMFGDWQWEGSRTYEETKRFTEFQSYLVCKKESVVIVEIGAGTAVPTVRYMSESLSRLDKFTLIRINPGEPEVPKGQISIQLPGLQALQEINKILQE